MKRYLIGFVVGICTAASVAFAIDHSDVDWSGAGRDRAFAMAVKTVIKSSCTVDVTTLVEDGYIYGRRGQYSESLLLFSDASAISG